MTILWPFSKRYDKKKYDHYIIRYDKNLFYKFTVFSKNFDARRAELEERPNLTNVQNFWTSKLRPYLVGPYLENFEFDFPIDSHLGIIWEIHKENESNFCVFFIYNWIPLYFMFKIFELIKT